MSPDSVAIVGAGPAGALAARRLAMAGARVTLFDGSQGREKPCGGGVTPRAVSGIPEIREILPAARGVCAYRFASDRGREARVDCEASSYVFARSDLDGNLRSLARKAGAELIETMVRDLRAESGKWRLGDAAGRIHRAAILVGADGASSFVRKTLFPDSSLPGLRCQLFYIDEVRSGDEDNEVVFPSDLPSYLWSFPRQEHLSVGICAAAPGARQGPLIERLDRYVARRFPGRATRDPHRLGGMIPLRDERSPPVAGQVEGSAFAFLGDAAGLADPLTGEGISQALSSANALSEALVAGDLASYGSWVDRTLVPEAARARRVAPLFYRPAFIDTMLLLAEKSARIRRVLSDLIQGSQGYRGLRRRLLTELGPAILQMAGKV